MKTFRWLYREPTRYDFWPPPYRWLAVGLLAALIVYGYLSYDASSLEKPDQSGSVQFDHEGDLKLYIAIVNRIQAGEPYYLAAGAELRQRGYATVPVWNWRLPTLALLLGKPPGVWFARLLLIALALGVIWFWYHYWLLRESVLNAFFGLTLIVFSCIQCITPGGLFLHENWAGILISLSIAAYGNRKYRVAVAAAVAAVFFRELALPYLLIVSIMLYRDKQYACVWAGGAGLLAFFVYLIIHFGYVYSRLTDNEIINSWVRFHGWPFVLLTSKWNGLFIIMPNPLIPVLVPLSLLGIIGWRSNISALVMCTLLGYMVLFMTIGREDNYYWGMIYSHLIAIGLLYAPGSLRSLLWKRAEAGG